MSVNTILTIAAQCDRAARNGTNEDSCLVVPSVGRAKTVSPFEKGDNSINPTESHYGDVTGLSAKLTMGDKGCLLVVADGMGGMNAGEVASQIAVTTLAKCFSEEGTKNLEMTDTAIRKFIRKTILAADEAIKKAAAKDKEKEGMGTTVVLLWLLPNNTAYYAWCGDSRLYRYTPDDGLQTLSHDHSYVMEVLHLSEEEAFVHPDNNIITRSLGNPLEKANPDIEGPIEVYQDDLFLLCSDGLCGALPSLKILENISCIEDVIEEHIPDADHLMDGINELWTACAAAGWHDNVTTLLCQVKAGPKRPEAKKKPKALQTSESNTSAPPIPDAVPLDREDDKKRDRKDTLIALFAVALVAALAVGAFFMIRNIKIKRAEKEKAAQEKVEVKPNPQDTLNQETIEGEFLLGAGNNDAASYGRQQNAAPATQQTAQSAANPEAAGSSPASATAGSPTETATTNSVIPNYRNKSTTNPSASQNSGKKEESNNNNNNTKLLDKAAKEKEKKEKEKGVGKEHQKNQQHSN